MGESNGKMLQAALRYAELGYPVFPCVPRGKAPATAHGFLDATTDAGQITAGGRRGRSRTSACRPPASWSWTSMGRTIPGPATTRRSRGLPGIHDPSWRPALHLPAAGGQELEQHRQSARAESRHSGQRRLHRPAAFGCGRQAISMDRATSRWARRISLNRLRGSRPRPMALP